VYCGYCEEVCPVGAIVLTEWFEYSGRCREDLILGSTAALSNSEESVNSKLRNLEGYGFSREEVRKIVIGSPAVLNYNEDSLKAKLRNLEKERKFPNGFVLKFTKEEVKELILSFPAILSYSEYTAGWKIRAMACVSEGDKQEMIEMGKLWMQSARKTVRRANYLNKKGIEWKHTGKVFMSEKNFKRTYGVSL
jgi:ferredoxin